MSRFLFSIYRSQFRVSRLGFHSTNENAEGRDLIVDQSTNAMVLVRVDCGDVGDVVPFHTSLANLHSHVARRDHRFDGLARHTCLLLVPNPEC